MYHTILVRSQTQEQQNAVEAKVREILKIVDPNPDKHGRDLNCGCMGSSLWGSIAETIPSEVDTSFILSITEAQVLSLFELAGFTVKRIHTLANEYYGGSPRSLPYAAVAPWFLVQTTLGDIKIGPRKRVFNIEWHTTELREEITEDYTTKGDIYVHARTVAKISEYLSTLHTKLGQQKARGVGRSWCPRIVARRPSRRQL
jgi:hypothetical protein